ncbi:MAG: aminodeoxychorismate synthase component I [Alphaproteobacteria bacterium]
MQFVGWKDPLEVAAAIGSDHIVLLYSGTKTSYSGQYSYLAYGLREKIIAENFSVLEAKLTRNNAWYENAWFGYFGYDLKNTLEDLPRETHDSYIALPDICMMRFGAILRFDHDAQQVEGWSDTVDVPLARNFSSHTIPPVKDFRSNMTNAEYRDKASLIIDAIHKGDLYQANLTRKFYGEFDSPVDNFALFKNLCTQSPSPYSAYIRMQDTAICSSSPELFLRISDDGRVETRPIKGTSPRMPDAEADRKSFESLAASQKDRAENLMITDLMRNDLARTCVAGSVTVQDMFAVTSHSNVHHMASTVRGIKKQDYSTLDIIRHCFPPGSMTGAPKIKAMKLCTALEDMARGVYAGAIGFLGGTGNAEFSVVIRTIITQGTRFEFQVGGGIVADSTPQSEMQETFDKAKGIINTLRIAPEVLETL